MSERDGVVKQCLIYLVPAKSDSGSFYQETSHVPVMSLKSMGAPILRRWLCVIGVGQSAKPFKEGENRWEFRNACHVVCPILCLRVVEMVDPSARYSYEPSMVNVC